MSKSRLSGSVALIVALCAAVLGCAGSSATKQQLRTSAQSEAFIAAVARHGEADGWTLSAGASPSATRVWAERAAIADLGTRLRREGGEWGCELAANTFRVGHVGIYSVGDRQVLADHAVEAGAAKPQVKAFEADFLKMSMADLREATAAVCPGAYFG